MTTLYIDGSSAPEEIKRSLRDLSRSIQFHREDSKAANGYVFFGTNRVTGTQVTLKYYYWGGKTQYHAEPRQLAKLDAENVLKILDAGLIDATWAYFITPTCAGGDLDSALESHPVGLRAALDYVHQILCGLSHLHASRYLHRDIKPANLYLTDADKVVIGDFGSVKLLPEAQSAIPASSHSLIYRPPETIVTNTYGVTGDIYQCGLVLYQLLGGSLPYDGPAWLNKREQVQLSAVETQADKDAFLDCCIKAKITAGRAVDLSTLPPWVPNAVRRIVSKACHRDPQQRYQAGSTFMAKLHEVRTKTLDWRVIDGVPTCHGNPSYRIRELNGHYSVQKNAGNGWRNDRTAIGGSLAELVAAVASKA
ncbi:protein kinase [Xanthomonas sp. 1678]|uniref:serine/threonine protein kinase n=1 Tax=Xanthomonas sp. 1678 TaxID=3158788 RepID=UPI0028624D5C|nr:serine/threonine protein kinase [Xanthomonas translucens]